MSSRDFCYWLQGYFEVSAGKGFAALDGAQVEIIRKHLALVFIHDIDPQAGGKEVQAKLNSLHDIYNPSGVQARC